jgi:O-antigen/teichoic acid export membrane protein
MLTIITAPAASYFGAQLIPNAREKKYLVAVLAGAASNVVLNLFLIPKYGALAAAFTTAFSQGVVALMNYWFARDLTGPSLLAAVAMSFPATCLMAASLVSMRILHPLPVLALVTLGTFVYLGVYAVSLNLWNRISASGAEASLS